MLAVVTCLGIMVWGYITADRMKWNITHACSLWNSFSLFSRGHFSLGQTQFCNMLITLSIYLSVSQFQLLSSGRGTPSLSVSFVFRGLLVALSYGVVERREHCGQIQDQESFDRPFYFSKLKWLIKEELFHYPNSWSQMGQSVVWLKVKLAPSLLDFTQNCS